MSSSLEEVDEKKKCAITISSAAGTLIEENEGEKYGVIVCWLPLAKDMKIVKCVAARENGVKTFTIFIPDSSHIPLKSVMRKFWTREEKIQVETVINGEQAIFPYMNIEDWQAFCEVILKEEERQKHHNQMW